MQVKDCIFCKILRRELPSTGVYEDELVYAFRDINPVAPTHILIIPKKHILGVQELQQEDECLVGHMFYVAKKIAEQEGLSGGYRLVFNVGKDAGQTVFHLHLHLIGGRSMNWPPG
ncbi:histidine triad (HIT) protein [Thermocrinis albus DSM 14484]|uniref:Histidine triad (HIT) protein n=1 Tax=Thermocrinis albus (strain DSM 14484 / JCM 11386 / HI 11/12) TaxID=638303 RepID=D3SPZ2_THEAH|nr:histidine triad nucleotide-binding protein [Thermocrinis albus]ADC89229.1 histidine triad (HIT) protein [Thermocrinis albus DSM 14484]